MKKSSLKFIYRTLLVGCLITVFSCKKALQELPVNQVDVVNHYQNVYDANAAVIGIYGKFMGIADRYVVLNELRADLMSPTANADLYLKQLNEHTVTTDNPWADPKPWYNIILNINDAMSHFNEMLKTGKLSNNDYLERYYDIGAIRCWLYLQLGTQFGDQVIYVTDPIASIEDLKDKSKFQPIAFTQLIQNLVAFMEEGASKLSGPGLNYYPYNPYSASDPINGSTNSSLAITVDGYSTSNFFVPKDALLGELDLWAGKYHNAAIAFRHLMDRGVFTTGGNLSAQQTYEQYKAHYASPGSDNSTGSLTIWYQGTPNTPNSSQAGPQIYDDNNRGWRAIFGATGGTLASCEWIWQLPFTPSFQPTDPFINLFSNQGGSYLLTASKQMMNIWDGNYPNLTPAVQVNGYPFDARRQIAVKTINGQPVIMKNLYYYLGSSLLPTNILQKTSRWNVYRGGALNERIAEAADNDGQYKLAYALLNVGVHDVFYDQSAVLPGSDVTNTEQTFLPPPYDLDARSGGPQNYHGIWYRQDGTRTRGGLIDLPDSLYNGTASDEVKKRNIEDAIIEENARELSFEGYRWGDLLRIALRRNDPSFLANKVRDKLAAEPASAGAAGAAYSKLLAGGYYMPFKL
jgi:hypothetical protein